MKLLCLVLLIGIVHLDSARSLKCQEGFNATILEMPLYYWNLTDCDKNSVCFSQELSTKLPLYDLEVAVRYGGCIASGYSKLVTCEKLFGEDSDLDLSILFNMLPSLDEKFSALGEDFRQNTEEKFRTLFSNGTAGPESLVDGFYRLLTNLGLKTEKAFPLRKHFVQLLDVAFSRQGEWVDYTQPGPPKEETDQLINEFLKTLQTVTEAYKLEYPKSELPDLVWAIAQYVNVTSQGPPYYDCYSMYNRINVSYTEVNQCYDNQNRARMDFYQNMYNMGMEMTVDIQFAVFSEIDFGGLDIYKEISNAFPEFGFFVRLMKVLDRNDIKTIYKDFYKLFMPSPGHEYYRERVFEKITRIFNGTVSRITSKLGDFNKELRGQLSPKSCKFDVCDSDSCNTHMKLTNIEEMVISSDKVKNKIEKEVKTAFEGKIDKTAPRDSPKKISKATFNATVHSSNDTLKATNQPSTTTSFSSKIAANWLLNSIALFIIRKFV